MSYDWLLLGISSSAWNFADTAMSTSSKMFERVKSAVSSKYVLRRVVQEPTASEKLLAFFGNGATFLYIVKNGIEIYEICCEPKGKQAVLIAKKVATMVAGTQGSTIGATVGSTVLPGIGTFVGGVAGAVGGEYVVEMVGSLIQ